MLTALREWRTRSKFIAAEDLVFPNRYGGYINHRAMVKYFFEPLFKKLEEKWKAERRNEPLEVFTWHALRHFAISCWIEAGLPPKAVQTFAGHSSLQVTMDRYGHLFRSDDHGRVMDAISNEICASAEPTRDEPVKRAPKSQFTPA